MSIKGLEQSEAIAKSLDRRLKRTLNAQKMLQLVLGVTRLGVG